MLLQMLFYLHNKRPQCVFLHLYHVKVILLKLFEITLVLILDLSCLLFNSLDTKLLTVFTCNTGCSVFKTLNCVSLNRALVDSTYFS